MATVRSNTKQHETKSCPRKDGFFDTISPQLVPTSLELVPTEDGSLTIRGPWGETYHSVSGAVQESQHVYIGNGLRHYIQKNNEESSISQTIHILDVGFGTGLNALLTYRELVSGLFPESTGIFYEAVEKFPLPEKFTEKLLYADSEQEMEFFRNIHRGSWGVPFPAAKGFTVLKHAGDLVGYHPLQGIHVVYFDPFSPAVQPELWTSEIIAGITPCLQKNAVLTTYSCRGSFKRVLRGTGFLVERLQGIGKKRHVLRAVYCPHNLLITGATSSSMIE
ncbi:MAG: tRNA (5-methylaminomethyl-2-thiouridine)(34)-methyltransferase MnmD [Bacteroidales bacterium]|nr:tRNA (5-methylaminomethyl-2-thiouridine)(34)-methyltransferase MnmD [Bacteroidales bacterium]MDD4031160.1 tRNA (5-methylaminomethyl-2-thiouridine)(34)-methyltransferase MnmD [Bacteroidales bacterium]MDD4435504.1 tRNA (5-methylaminomethyl-2-thiouridine)(34)-methyltransferase MnmD [Bacteroidales bacterium]MDD5732399.1 tRNA (5-methylaminomethyl-2-thiouridine)(34)-methyltransferase MnmD [Bacteroidales bacterium]